MDHVLNTKILCGWGWVIVWLVGTFSGNGQTLPDSAFINPLGTRKLLTLSEKMNNLSLQSGQVGATKAAKAADLAQTCCVCMGMLVLTDGYSCFSTIIYSGMCALEEILMVDSSVVMMSEYVGDTVQLECSHAFCVQCVLKVLPHLYSASFQTEYAGILLCLLLCGICCMEVKRVVGVGDAGWQ